MVQIVAIGVVAGGQENHGFNKQTGEVHQFDKRSKKMLGLTDADFVLLTNRMYLLIDALESRREGAKPWHASLQHWDDPQKFWEEQRL